MMFHHMSSIFFSEVRERVFVVIRQMNIYLPYHGENKYIFLWDEEDDDDDDDDDVRFVLDQHA